MTKDDLMYCEHHNCTWAKVHCVQRRRRALEARACSITILRQKFPTDDTIRYGYCATCKQGIAIGREHDGPVADPRDTFRVQHGYGIGQTDQAKKKRPQNYVRPRCDFSSQIEAHGCRTEAELIQKLYAKHGDMRLVGVDLGCSKTVITKRMREYGIPITARYKHGR